MGKYWPLLGAFIVLGLTTFGVVFRSLQQNDNHFVYAIDDAYIHMAVAKNFAQSGVWGVTRYEFSSSTSSLAWPLLIAAVFRVTGPHELTPLVLNIILAAAIVIVSYFMMGRYNLRGSMIFAILVTMMLLTPFPVIIFTGMEHTLQLLISLLFVFTATQILEKDQAIISKYSRMAWFLIILTILVTSARFEGVFLVAMVCGLFVLRRKIFFSVLLGFASLIPIIGFGLISLANGWYWLPNSVLLKANTPDLHSMRAFLKYFSGWDILYKVTHTNPHMGTTILVAAILLVFLVRRNNNSIWYQPALMLGIFIGASLLQVQFASTGWFYRYEAYLIALGILAIGVGGILVYRSVAQNAVFRIYDHWIYYPTVIIIALLIMWPLLHRGFRAITETPRATTNIYQNHYQMGLFLKKYYPSAYVAATGIGAITFMTDVHLVDLGGLGSLETAQAALENFYNADWLEQHLQLRQIQIGVIQENDPLFRINGGDIPSSWVRVGQWTYTNDVVGGDTTVSFFAIDPGEADTLTRNLRLFASELPEQIIQAGSYIEGN